MANPRELPTDRVYTIGEQGEHVKLYPAVVPGFWRQHKSRVHAVLIGFFLLLPWIKINGKQALLFDIVDREFSIFGFNFFAHDGPIVFFLLGIASFSLALFTTLFGRVWCGWSCPQTVFLESVFRRIENWIEGNHIQRMNLDKEPINFTKVLKKSTKWLVFVLFTLIITHSFLAIFVGSEELLQMIRSNPKHNWTSFVFILITSAILLFNFAWFREQFCLIVCPYGRLQSVLLDSHSSAVAYDIGRGEPRKGQVPPGGKQGDCVSCYQCVAVCPTGIDIRRGLQMECIQCTACIDACDSIMEKINKPKGLIRYASRAQLSQRKQHWMRPRVGIYLGFIIVLIIGLLVTLNNRKSVHVTLLRANDVPFRVLENSGGQIINHFKLHIKNQTLDQQQYLVEIDDVQLRNAVDLIVPQNPIKLERGQLFRQHIFIKFMPSIFNGSGQLKVNIRFSPLLEQGKKPIVQSLMLLGPSN